jgi:Fur family ferric uptake transcriptional regulator
VYRNLELLSEAREIMKLELSGKQKRFDGNTEKHYHLRCTKCGRVEDVDPEKTKEVDEKLNELVKNMDLDDFRLELSGLCSYCKQRAD